MLVTNEYTLYVLTTASIALGSLIYESDSFSIEQAREFLARVRIDEDQLKDVVDAALAALKEYQAVKTSLVVPDTSSGTPPILH